jgi:hypothetical protein
MNKLVVFSVLSLIGCSSTRTINGVVVPEFEKSEVIERIGGIEETPKWAIGDVPMTEEGANLLYSYVLTLDGNTRTDSCLSIAEIKTKASILEYVRTNITASGQVSEQGGQSDPAYESLIAFLTSGKLSGVKTVGRYWEKRIESDTTGNRVLKVKCAARVSIARTELERQLRESFANKGNPEVREKLLKAQTDFIEKLGE